MSKDLKYIDDLVKKSLNDLTIESPIGSWEMLEKNIPQKGFFRLDVSSFNIYYLSMIAVASITIIVSLNFNKAEKLIPTKNQIANTKINDKQEIINADKNNIKESSNSFNLKNNNTINSISPKEKNIIKQKNTTQDLISTLNTSKQNTKNNYDESIVKGSNNKYVKDLQKALNIKYKANLIEDGIYGSSTEQALIKFKQPTTIYVKQYLDILK